MANSIIPIRSASILSIAIFAVAACHGGSAASGAPSADSLKAGSAALPQYIELGGIKQAVRVAGSDPSHPVLLMLHGGPGFTEMALFAEYNRDLEDKFIVATWDQRGAGLSYSPDIPESSMNLEQFVSDARELVNWLKKRYDKEKIYLLGHSWGSVVGVYLAQRHPEDFYAYIGVGQGVNLFQNESLSFEFVLASAIAEGDEEAIAELKAIQPRYPPNAEARLEDFMLQRKWLGHFGGAIYKQRNADGIFSRINTTDNPLYDRKKAQAGNDFTFPLLFDELMRIDLATTAPKLEVPVYFITGRHDHNTPFQLVEAYAETLEAPLKEIIWFEKSAHWIPFEEPEKFYDVLVNKVRKHSEL